MAYVPTVWENDPDSSTPISAENLNKMEQGIFDAGAQADRAVSDASSALEAVQELQGLNYAPIPVTLAADMTDTSKLYLYIGSESGMQNNYWYYYNGSVWTPGGLYNAVSIELDTTLSHSGEAADAKAVGDAIKAFGGTGVHIVNVATGITVSSTDVEVAYSLFETARDDENVLINGMLCGTISAANTVIAVNVYLDGDEAFTYSQICIAGLNAIPVIVGVPIENAGNHIISIECSATSGTFAI